MKKKHWWDDWGSDSFYDDDYYGGGSYDPYSSYYSPSTSYTGSSYTPSTSYYGSWSGTGKKSKYKSSLGYSSDSLSSTTSWWSGYSTSSVTSGDDVNKMTELLQKAYRTARDMVIILDFPFRVHVQFAQEPYYPGQDRRIFISSRVFDDRSYDDSKKINIFCGIGIHEAAHLKYTSYSIIESLKDMLCSSREKISVNLKPDSVAFFSVLFNILEDERIEDSLLRERPGYAEFIQDYKTYKYKSISDITPSGQAEEFLYELIKLIRFQDNLKEEVLEKYENEFKQIHSIIYPLPESTRETYQRTVKLFDELFRIFKELTLSEDELKDESKISSMMSQLTSGMKKMGQEMGSPRSMDEGSGVYDECMYGSDKDSEKRINSLKLSRTLRENEIIEKLVAGTASKGLDKNSFIIDQKGRPEIYMSCKTRIQPYVSAIRKLIKASDRNYDFVVQGCRSGLLDTTKLAEAYQGVPQVYIRKGEVRTNKTTVCVLVDESGSMGYCNKDNIARDAAVLLNEALGCLSGIDLYIYGHTADLTYTGSTELYAYREGKNVRDKYALSQIRGRHENRDGQAIYEAACRVRKHTQDSCIMFVISDGSPCASGYWGESAYRDVRSKVQKVEAMGFSVIQVSIDHVHRVEDMFDKHISLEHDVANFPKTLSKVIKKAIMKDKKTTIL